MKSKKGLLVILVVAGILLTIMWSKGLQKLPSSSIKMVHFRNNLQPLSSTESLSNWTNRTLANQKLNRTYQNHHCQTIQKFQPDIDTTDVYPTLNFNARWIAQREFWSESMEKRYKRRRTELWPKVPLKVIIMPHSHNDPGWLKTYEGYFHSSTKLILDNAVDKLTKYKDMTFVWTEISFLSLWWDNAHQTRKSNLKRLVDEGRFEILTGGWVMTDEANVDIFSMVDQLVEGHQWLLRHLGVRPRSSWSVDPFGHGAAFPYVLKSSGLDSMVIMRIHYAWKEWFAKEQSGDFMWRQHWDGQGKHDILCHNFPFDIYSVKGSCGPQAQTCVQFNFAQVPGRYSEYTGRTVPITRSNVKERSELILEQWGKSGSLFPHNVVLVPLGDDFTYTNEGEWDQQYSNYNQIVEYINQNVPNAHIQWGTLSDYFALVHGRTNNFDILSGDFFVYSDVFSDGVPAYWSGYYSTRPYMKRLSRELAANLRSAEILFTLAYNTARQIDNRAAVKSLVSTYATMVTARKNLALFQHHDAITGTAKQFVTHDYGEKLYEGIVHTRSMQKSASQYLLLKDRASFTRRFLESDYTRPDYSSRPKPLPLEIKSGPQHLIVANNLGQDVDEVVSFFLEGVKSRNNICARGPDGTRLAVQISPTWSIDNFVRLETHFVEASFYTRLPALSITKFTVHLCDDQDYINEIKEGIRGSINTQTQVFCLRCPRHKKQSSSSKNNSSSPFVLDSVPDGSVVISNGNLELTFDEDTRLLAKMKDKRTGVAKDLKVSFGGYPTMPFRNGAYLFKPDTQHRPEILPVIDPIDNLREVVIISGQVFSEMSLIYEAGQSAANQASFVHTVRLYHAPRESHLSKGIYMENNFNLGDQNNFRDVDIFMRVESAIKNLGNEWYTDSSGLTMQRRTPAVNASGLEGNIYPITTMAYLEDSEARLSIVVDHATGASSQQQGWLEVIVDRRASYDDSRGMGEGVLDNKDTEHCYWLLFESKTVRKESPGNLVSLPTSLANHMSRKLNHPVNQFVCSATSAKGILRGQLRLLEQPLPDDIHLFNLRTLSNASSTASSTVEKPSNTALLTVHRQTPACNMEPDDEVVEVGVDPLPKFGTGQVRVASVRRTSLTGNSESENDETLDSLRTQRWNVEPMTLEALKLQFA